MRSGLFVGELAKQGGVDPWTIRYYEKERLIPQAPRSTSRYRMYPKETVDLIRFIKTAQGLGLTLEEIKKVIDAKRLKGKPCEHVVKLLETKVGDLHRKIEEMGRLKKTIGGLLRNWQTVRKSKTTCICEIIESAGQRRGEKKCKS
ncbi:MAG: MerR family transcriptional regulator [Deltaproteobacteria bacterium]|nr:MerR family transcriptional regulator [Deltaproteobacteria bacterium]